MIAAKSYPAPIERGTGDLASARAGSGRKNFKNSYLSPFLTDFEVGEEIPKIAKKYRPKGLHEKDGPLGNTLDQKIGAVLAVQIGK